jgi:hypothetical protein
MKIPLQFLSLITLAVAVPKVIPIPTGRTDCRIWPGWMNARPSDTTSSLMFTVFNSDDAAINGLPLQPFSIPWGSGKRNFLGATLLASRSIAKSYYRCIDGVPVVMSKTDEPIAVAKDMNNAHLLIAAAEGTTYRTEIFEHEIDGVKQDGWYLGAQNQTTWGFHYRAASCLADGTPLDASYEVKLLGLPVDPENEPTAGYPAEFEGFLRVDLW